MSTRAEHKLVVHRRCGPLLVLTGTIFILAGCGRRAPAPDRVLDSLVAANPCNESLPEVTRAPESLTAPQSCALLAAAMRRLGQGGAGDLPQPVDTSNVATATIDAMSERDFSEKEKGAWWVVTLQLRDVPFNAEVRFDRQTGAMRIRSVHK
jgi:hypothetical protein